MRRVIKPLSLFFIGFLLSYPVKAHINVSTWNTVNGYKIYQVLDGRSSSFCSNCFVVESGKNFIMIDTGSRSKWDELQANLNQVGVNRNNFKALILTHAHFDHVENALKIKNMYGTQIIINKSEGRCLAKGKNSKTGTVNFALGLFKYEPASPDILTDEVYDLKELGFANCRIMKTAGHTMGSVCIVIDDEVVIAGDTIVNFSDDTLPWFIVSPKELSESWKNILDTGSRLFLPAHGGAVSRELLLKNYIKLVSE